MLRRTWLQIIPVHVCPLCRSPESVAEAGHEPCVDLVVMLMSLVHPEPCILGGLLSV